MSLTREQRKRIDQEEQLKMEEEEYRAEVRKRVRTESESSGGISPLARVVLFLGVIAAVYLYFSGSLG